MCHLFQSTLPRGERRSHTKNICEGREISIHAPTRGATCQCPFICTDGENFNPRSREGSDNYKRINMYLPPISIHAPARGATALMPYLSPAPGISIHAPARGATRAESQVAGGNKDFNPRSREGSDLGQTTAFPPPPRFQSTLPRGERPQPPCRSIPTPRISIHAPARGATLLLDDRIDLPPISIHAPARGATAHGEPPLVLPPISIHAPARGATIRNDHI